MPINSTVKLCGARCRTKNGAPCTQPAMKNGRCKMHGGKCKGPTTEAGRKRLAEINFKHGRYTKEAMQEKKAMREMMKWRHDLKEIK